MPKNFRKNSIIRPIRAADDAAFQDGTTLTTSPRQLPVPVTTGPRPGHHRRPSPPAHGSAALLRGQLGKGSCSRDMDRLSRWMSRGGRITQQGGHGRRQLFLVHLALAPDFAFGLNIRA